MAANFVLEVLHVVLQLRNYMLLLQDFQVLLALVELYQVLDPLIYAILETLQLIESLIREIFGWGLVLLHRL